MPKLCEDGWGLKPWTPTWTLEPFLGSEWRNTWTSTIYNVNITAMLLSLADLALLQAFLLCYEGR